MKFEINKRTIDFYLNKDIYDNKAIMKAAYNFTDEFYVILDYVDENIRVTLEKKDTNEELDLESVKGKFYNEVLKENIRYIVSKDTKNIRELLMGRALYDTCIECDDNEEIHENIDETVDDNLDIFMNWFDKNEE